MYRLRSLIKIVCCRLHCTKSPCNNFRDRTSNDDFESFISATRTLDIKVGHECYPASDVPADVESGSKATFQIKYVSDEDWAAKGAIARIAVGSVAAVAIGAILLFRYRRLLHKNRIMRQRYLLVTTIRIETMMMPRVLRVFGNLNASPSLEMKTIIQVTSLWVTGYIIINATINF